MSRAGPLVLEEIAFCSGATARNSPMALATMAASARAKHGTGLCYAGSLTVYLYLTTTGRVTGQPPEIEIWFTEHGGHFYLVAERESANWVRNIHSQPQIKVRVGDAEFNALARVVHNEREPQLAATVKALFDAKYGWSAGLIAELTPA